MKKKHEEKACLHPMETATKVQRMDGSGLWDLVCECGYVMCETSAPVDSAAQVVAEAKAAHCINTECPNLGKDGCTAAAEGFNMVECDDYITVSPYVCMTEDCSHYGQDLDGSNCTHFGNKDILECVDFTSAKDLVESTEVAEGEGVAISVPEVSTTIEEGGDPFGLDALKQTTDTLRKPDKVSSQFLRPLPVAVPDEDLAEHAKEQSRLFRLWTKTHLDKKACTKSCNAVIEEAETKMLEIAQIVEAGTEERQVPCQWEFDYREGIKRLRRLDTLGIVETEILQGEELHLSFNFNGSSEAAVEKLAEVQAGASGPVRSLCADCVSDADCVNSILPPSSSVTVCARYVAPAPCKECSEHAGGCGESSEDRKDCAEAMSAGDTPLTDDPSETCRICEGAGYFYDDDPDKEKSGETFCDCEAGKLLEKQSAFTSTPEISIEEVVQPGVDESLPVIEIGEKPELSKEDKERRCCFPLDRDEVRDGDVIISYCRECLLIHKKSPVNGDPWDTIDFPVGEKINAELLGAEA